MNEERLIQDRRDFLKAGAAVGVGAAIAGLGLPGAPEAQAKVESRTQFAVKPIDVIRVGFVGVGGMGSTHVQNYLNIDGVVIKAICDIVPEKVARAQKWVVAAGQPNPAGYSKGPTDFVRMCESED